MQPHWAPLSLSLISSGSENRIGPQQTTVDKLKLKRYGKKKAGILGPRAEFLLGIRQMGLWIPS